MSRSCRAAKGFDRDVGVDLELCVLGQSLARSQVSVRHYPKSAPRRPLIDACVLCRFTRSDLQCRADDSVQLGGRPTGQVLDGRADVSEETAAGRRTERGEEFGDRLREPGLNEALPVGLVVDLH